MRLDTEVVFNEYKDRLYAAALNITKNPEDAKDAVQDTIIKYITANKSYESEEHIRAWLFTVVINLSKNMVTSFWHRNKKDL